ncbi:RNA polymerase sigma factor, partial [Kitasatospora sp. NPDC059648]|uniref:RNA polymerase sigma factor n=1 Tax=Kitasatospora sp. NPDC059648 TaxID=3346894 RepID=UPI003697CD8A
MRARLRAGEPAAFAGLFDGYARSVYNHAFRLTADWATADESSSGRSRPATGSPEPSLRWSTNANSGWWPNVFFH